MQSSASIIQFIKNLEKCYLTPYWDSKGWSAGYGHFLGGTQDSKPDDIDQQQADTWLGSDLIKVETVINNWLAVNSSVDMSQMRFDGLVDFGYNCGTGSLSKVLATLKTGNEDSVAIQISKYNLAKNSAGVRVVNAGLVSRRKYEIDLMQLKKNVTSSDEKKNNASDYVIEIGALLFVLFLVFLIFKKKLI